MTELEYHRMATACDHLLRASDTSLGRLAVPLLHVVNEHRAHLTQYATAGTRGGQARDMVRIGRGLARSIGRSESAFDRASTLGKIDVLIVSRAANLTLLDNEDDFYFGSMQRSLTERGITSALVLVNHLYRDDVHARVFRPAPAARLLLPHAVSLPVEIRVWRQCLSTRARLRMAARTSGKTIEGAMALLASRQALSAGTAANLRTHASLSTLCNLLNPGIVITTYEGDASERIIWHAARGNDRKPLCVGYQHTGVSQRAHAIRRLIRYPGVNCDPDILLTLGPVPQAMLAAGLGLDSVRMIEYGSHRRAQPVPSAPLEQRPRICIVLAEADERECALLFDFALDCARRIPDVTFRLRPHPTTRVTALQARHPALRKLPGNVQLSMDVTLEQDCATARYCLYRGSSAAMHAVLAGIKPFFLARANELPFDPLFALPCWRETVNTPDEFSKLIRASDSAADPETAERAWSFCDRYIRAVRDVALDELLELRR
jgi:hypothetical protein